MTIRPPPASSHQIDPPDATSVDSSSRAITWRSVLLGSAGVCFICGLTPYNDFVVMNTLLVGGYLPLAVVLTVFVLVVLINAPLHWLTPKRPLSSGELAIILAMMLVSCALPGQGLLKFLLPELVAPFYHGSSNASFWRTFISLELPDYLFPIRDQVEGRSSPILAYFVNRVPEGTAPPYAAWITPLVVWGVYVGAWMAMLLAIAVVLRPQWAVNERLAFPLAQLQLALIQPPERGRLLNSLFRSRAFWIGLIGVFTLHSFSGLNAYFPAVPKIPLGYDLTGIFVEEPWRHLHANIKQATIFFTFVGVTYFIQSRVGFSLWATFLMLELFVVQRRTFGADLPQAAMDDQHLGSAIAFLCGILWIGRHHWRRVVRHLVMGLSEDERRQGAVCYRVPALVIVGSLLVMGGWLWVMGVSLWVIGLILGFTVLAHVVIARIVAETGIPFMRININTTQIYTSLPAAAVSGRDVFFAGMTQPMGAYATREGLLVFAQHAMRIRDGVDPPQRTQRGLVAVLVWALVLGFVVGTAAALACYYTYAMPLDATLEEPMVNRQGLTSKPEESLIKPMTQYASGKFPEKAHNPWLNMATGAGITGVLQVLSLRWASWPLMPVGYLVSMTWYMQMAWFSILLGWLAKVLILRFGGAGLFQSAKPLFVGIIFGEALAAAIWMVICLCLALSGAEYKAITLLPT